MAHQSKKKGAATGTLIVAFLVVIGVVAMVTMTRANAETPATIKQEAVNAYETAKKSLDELTQEAFSEIRETKQLFQRLSQAGASATEQERIAEEIAVKARLMADYADQVESAHAIVSNGTSDLDTTGRKIQMNADALQAFIDENKAAAQSTDDKIARLGFLNAMKIDEDTLRRWNTFQSFNGALQSGLQAQESRFKTFLGRLRANAKMFESAARSTRFSASIQVGSFGDIQDDLMEQMVEAMKDSWISLDGICKEMGRTADELMEVTRSKDPTTK